MSERDPKDVGPQDLEKGDRDSMKSNISILVVDDEEMMRSLLKKILERDGYRVQVAVDGQDALDKMTDNHIDLVISDLKMPRMDGFSLLKRIRQDYPRTGVIMMTAYGDTYTVKDALLLGADEYITKPFKSFDIALVVERAYWRLLSTSGRSAPQAG
ncbi:MAG: response regulator [candidate division Zixibacteria bacterium]|nr:response regulator [candidate division Zixibacteria bacterium]